MQTFFIILVVLVILILVLVASAYNRLVTLRNRTKNAFAQIDVQLKRRFDLIPKLIEVAKKLLAHEKETLAAVVEARSSAMGASQSLAKDPVSAEKMQQFLAVESQLKGKMMQFMVVAEAYPDLRSNDTMMQLTEELTGTENKISFSRQAFNDAIMIYNTALEVFPSNLIASFFGFKAGDLFVVEDPVERKAIKVDFDN